MERMRCAGAKPSQAPHPECPARDTTAIDHPGRRTGEEGTSEEVRESGGKVHNRAREDGREHDPAQTLQHFNQRKSDSSMLLSSQHSGFATFSYGHGVLMASWRTGSSSTGFPPRTSIWSWILASVSGWRIRTHDMSPCAPRETRRKGKWGNRGKGQKFVEAGR
eukprot:2104779-Rhodomonas_salina.1